LTVTIAAGDAAAQLSTLNVSTSSPPVVASYVTVHITLRDAFNNLIVTPAGGQANNSKLVIQGAHSGRRLMGVATKDDMQSFVGWHSAAATCQRRNQLDAPEAHMVWLLLWHVAAS
jgi:hypothetical protein